jgi:glycosyltransferase involved in cell wall biosynthesis
MASARPVLTIAFGGPAEIVDDAVGLAVPPRGTDQTITLLAEGLRDAVRNPEEWRSRGENGLQRARELFGWDAKVDRAIKLYRELINRKAESCSRALASQRFDAGLPG